MKGSQKRKGGKPLRLDRPDVSLLFAAQWLDSLDSDLYSLWRREGPAGLVTADVDLQLSGSTTEFLRRYWASESMSKYPFEIPGINREEKAYHSFFEAEERCSEANRLLCDILNRPVPERIRSLLSEARRRLRWLLSGISRDEVVQRAGWGPGASTSLPRRKSAHQIKWEFATHVTSSALPWFVALCKYGRVPPREVTIVDCNRVTTVPKNAKTDRVIAIEPDWNMFFQLGLGRSIRRRLMRIGLLTVDAQERNKALARCGSLTDSFATIDLRGASDSVSLALCELLLPSDLFRMMMELRSPYGEVCGQRIEYEKISSMGNGFTFELETALFWAISSSVAGEAVAYGDDIIVPSESASAVIDFLQVCGFECNPKKSWLTGPFRESCGGHFFKGVDVTPPYFRKPLTNLQSFISGANAIDFRSEGFLSVQHDVEECKDLLSCTVPRFLWGLRSAGDVCLWKPFDVACPTWDPDTQRFTGKGLFKRRRMVDAPQLGSYTAALFGQGGDQSFPGEEEIVYVGRWYAYA